MVAETVADIDHGGVQADTETSVARPRRARRRTDRRRSVVAGVAALSAVLIVVLTGCDSESGVPDAGRVQPTSSPPASTTATDRAVEMVNLGDSYSAGTGTKPLVADSPTLCQRSTRNMAHLVAADLHYRLVDVSCAGARTVDLLQPQFEGTPPQLDAVTPDTDIVTIMIGGNDANTFGNALSRCRAVADSDPGGSPCRDRYGRTFVRTVDTEIAPALVSSFTAIRERAPKARVLAVGYPWILPAHTACRPAMQIADDDIEFLRGLQTSLNTAIRRAAQRTGVQFVDMAKASSGRDACQPASRRWVEPMTGVSDVATAHPNERGQRGLADAVIAAIRPGR